ncbi:hypothetical protein [Intestinibacter sp.]|uniref:hypothetical protein n=1 Tax=Intestinibacter sp. TaxID=1965304 RepID=UPI002A74D265|nr:hypothetical protein [Intestinibacter sp.]MDY2736006.1 hypothetical protein [Intestinibacter sp.]MDY4574571.1 hypothetical protein [Intestinibacter sp.]
MEINYKCPVCSNNVVIKLSDVSKTIRCPKCNLKINVKKDAEFDKNIKHIKNKR